MSRELAEVNSCRRNLCCVMVTKEIETVIAVGFCVKMNVSEQFNEIIKHTVVIWVNLCRSLCYLHSDLKS